MITITIGIVLILGLSGSTVTERLTRELRTANSTKACIDSPKSTLLRFSSGVFPS